MADVLKIDPQSMTLGEVEEFESLTGISLSAIDDKATPRAKVLRGLVYIAQRRVEPGFSWEDAGKVRISDLRDFNKAAGDQSAQAAANS